MMSEKQKSKMKLPPVKVEGLGSGGRSLVPIARCAAL